MMEIMNSEVESAVKALSESVYPVKIYLFGSFANGQPDEGSDIDLCLITRNNGQRKIEVLRQARKALVHAVSMPVDLLVYGVEEFDERASLSNTFEHKIMNEGILIYEQ